MLKRQMSDYQDRYAGRPAAVLGGGPSLPDDVARLPKGSILIAVNYHALRLTRKQLHGCIDFMVYNDHPESDPLLLDAVQNAQMLTRVSPDPTSHIEFDVPVWTGFYSSNTAAWFALWMGCDPAILCGMDCYQGNKVYFHDYGHDCPVFHYPLDMHLRPWIEEGKNKLPHVERLKAMSGPLGQIFGYYQSQEAICEPS